MPPSVGLSSSTQTAARFSWFSGAQSVTTQSPGTLSAGAFSELLPTRYDSVTPCAVASRRAVATVLPTSLLQKAFSAAVPLSGRSVPPYARPKMIVACAW